MSIIKKDFPLCTLEISNQGNESSMWVNCLDRCLIRLSNINFKNDFDKFDFIDIDCKSGNAIGTINYNEEESNEIKDFLLLLNKYIIEELYDSNVIDDLLITKIIKLIKEHKNESGE